MRAGQLRHRGHIQQCEDTRSADGGNVRAWTTVATRWMAIKPSASKEVIENDRVVVRETVLITMRYCDGLSHRDRIVHVSTGRVYYIDSIIDKDLRKETLDVVAIDSGETVGESESSGSGEESGSE